jgi:hypothetical protein
VNNFLLKRSNQAQKFCSNILFISLVRPTEATKMTVTSIYRYKISFHLISCDLLEPAMLWIRYVYPGSESKIFHNGSRTRIRIQGKKAPDLGSGSATVGPRWEIPVTMKLTYAKRNVGVKIQTITFLKNR